MKSPLLLSLGLLFSLWRPASAGEDAYLDYVRRAPEFRPVIQDPAVMIGRWDTWIYMPWRFQWTIGTGDEGGRFCSDYGFNGGFTDHGEGPLDWLQKWQLRFYNDHTAAKGYLYLHGANSKGNFQTYQRDPRAVRRGTDGPQPIDAAMLQRLNKIIAGNVNRLKQSPMRVAYALDDEISWGAFVTPLPWRLNEDDQAYAQWLDTYYGGKAPKPEYVTPDFVLPQLGRRLAEIDFSPLLDRLTYNDSLRANFLGHLVQCANQADPRTPCGFVGGQAPCIWGGYDYAKLLKKIQFIEAYDLGSSQAIIRSLSPQNALPQVTTHFHSDQRGTANDIWQSWYYFAHGNRGMIGWVEGWFDGNRPRTWLADFRPTLKELGGIQGPKMVGAKWLDDGVALYYSHPSIQVSWCLDIEPHGKTWINRNGDHRLGTSHNVRKAWEHILTDAGIQYSFLAYDQVVCEGVPKQYRVLILPACFALSDIEARRIEDFCQRGGVVIADFGCGLFDQHGKGRSRGALDDLFGVEHDGRESRQDFFAGKLWGETDQDKGYSYHHYHDLFATLDCRLEDGFAVAERRLPLRTVRRTGRGTAVYLNLSPQRYLQYREEGSASDAHRRVFLEHVFSSGSKPWIRVTCAGSRPHNLEATCWSKNGRTMVFVVQKAATSGSEAGGGGAKGLVDKVIPLEIEFPITVTDVVDERSGKHLDSGRRFRVCGEARPGERVTVNGVACRREGRRFAAEITLRDKETNLVAESGGNRDRVRVVWDRYSEPRYRFSIDDNSFFLRDIAQKGYKSLFDCWYLKMLRDLHTKYGVKYTLNIYYTTGSDFSLPQFSDRYKPEWRDNAHWMRLAFHAYADKPDRPYQDTPPETMLADMDLVVAQIHRFAGEEAYAPPTVIHWGMMRHSAFKPLASRSVRVLSGSFKHGNRYDVNYRWNDEVSEYLSRHDAWKDFESGIIFSLCDLVCNNVPVDRTAATLEASAKDPNTAEIMDLFTHEQYFWPFYMRYLPDHPQRLDAAIRWVTEHGYKPVFFHEGFLGGRESACPCGAHGALQYPPGYRA